MPGLRPGEIHSHPGRPLEDHLVQTACLAERIAIHILGRAPQNLRTACLLHDVAKAHSKFQDRLKGKGRFPHAEPSSYIALALCRDIMMAEVIRCHHTQIKDNFINGFWYNTDYREISRVIAEVPVWPGSGNLIKELGIDSKRWRDFLPSSNQWDDLLDRLVDNTTLDASSWLDFRLLLSLLITADRLDAFSGGTADLELPVLSVGCDIVDKHLTSLKQVPLSKWRNRIRSEVLHKAENTISGPGVYTLTLPTGAGKTLIGLDLAVRIAQKENKRGIVYVLPFITIVEQNSQVAKSIFPVVQEDHHLAYEVNENEELDTLQRFVSLFRYWKEPVVVTTFAKLWDTLYSPKGNDSMSFHRLANSVVLLDEPQSIPARYWKGFGKTLEYLASRIGTTFILITATQPGIASGKELAPQNITIPQCRYSVSYYKQPVAINQMLDVIIHSGLSTSNTMIVANTRKAALEIYFTIREMNILAEQPFFLSSWVTPYDRKRIMKEIKKRENNNMPRYLVSTQVVEAGVDLDFSLVARDIGPLDSLIQVAGRCNRHMSDRQGQFLVFKINDDKGNMYAKWVYDSVMLKHTKDVIEELPFIITNNKSIITFSEMDIPNLLKLYYSKLEEALVDGGPWFEIIQGNWGCWYSLIEKKHIESTVFIDYNGEIKTLLNELKEMGNGLKEKGRQKQIWQNISEHAISVPEKELNNWFDVSGTFIIDEEEKAIEKINKGLWIINPKGVSRIYWPEFGFIPLEMYRKYNEL